MSKLPKATAARTGARPNSKRPYKRRLSNYLLDKSLQLRYVAVVTVLSALICGVLGAMIWRQANMASSSILDSAADLTADDAAYWEQTTADLDESLARDDTNLVVQMAVVAVGLIVVLFLYLVVMTHKVAGPLYKISGFFDRMAAGRLTEVWPLRKGDMLQDFFAKFKDMHDTLRNRARAEQDQIARLLAACEAAGVARDGALAEPLSELEALHERRKEALS